MKKSIGWICHECGLKHGNYGEDQVSTWHEGVCDVCEKKRAVTEGRDFGVYEVKVRGERKHDPEELYDFISSQIGFDTPEQEELREAVKLFGKLRYEQGNNLSRISTAHWNRSNSGTFKKSYTRDYKQWVVGKLLEQ